MMPAASLVKQALGPYVLTDRLGMGGVAEVYRAAHRDDRSAAAVKVLRGDRAEVAAHAESLRTEAAVLQRLAHPGIPAFRRAGEIQGRPAIAMQLFEGMAVNELVAQGRQVPGPQVLLELVAIAAYLHGEGVIHADIKLENVLWTAKRSVALIDFGNCREPGREGFLKRLFRPKPKAVFGTATYLAPELIAGALPTAASDVYALGVCAFLLLSGSPPFAAASQSSRVRANARAAPPNIGLRVRTVPGPCAVAIDACLAKDPDLRPADARVLAKSLAPLFDGLRASTAVPAIDLS